MCRRFALDLDWDAVAERFAVDEDDIDATSLPAPTYGVTPKRTIAVIAQGKNGRRHLAGAYWSLIPRWSGTSDLPYPTYNARVESAASKPTFAESTRAMRCIIPASGYYEWHGEKPFYFHADDDVPLHMAGLYSWWRTSAASPWMLTAAIITCPAVDGPSSVHNRMPMLVAPTEGNAWLDPAVDGTTLLSRVRHAGEPLSRALAFHEVAPLDGDGPELIRPLDRGEQPRLF